MLPGLLFEKIEDEAINKQIEKLMSTKKANEKTASNAVPSKDPVTYDESQE